MRSTKTAVLGEIAGEKLSLDRWVPVALLSKKYDFSTTLKLKQLFSLSKNEE